MAHLYWNHQKCLVKMQPRTAQSVSETGFRHHMSDKLLQQSWYRTHNGNQSSHHHTPFSILCLPTLGSGFGAPPSSSRLSSSILSTHTLYMTSRSLFFFFNKLYLCLALLLPLATVLSPLIIVKINSLPTPSPLSVFLRLMHRTEEVLCTEGCQQQTNLKRLPCLCHTPGRFKTLWHNK